jgi:outer membrane immunogenic protein
MKQLIALGCGALALVAAGTASAADLPARAPIAPKAPVFVAPVYNWTGFYIGINGGGAWAHKCWDLVFAAGVGGDGCHDPNGGMFGGQVGFNWQTGAFVFGIEGSGDWASLTGTNPSLQAPLTTNRSKVDAIWTATGRVGYAFDAALLYVKGGGAWVSDKYDNFTTVSGAANASASETRNGWTIGGGIEWGFAQNWSVAVEYAHYDFGRNGVAFVTPAGIPAGTERINQTIDAVTARLNYRFGWGSPVVARY